MTRPHTNCTRRSAPNAPYTTPGCRLPARLSPSSTSIVRPAWCRIWRDSASRTCMRRRFPRLPGSTHGYDVVDHNELNPELGGVEGWKRLLAVLRRHDMGLVVDFVSNHMGIGAPNPYWIDVLENGPASPYARMFDIDWAQGGGKLLIPVLGDQYGLVLERGELKLVWEDGAFRLRYWDNLLPLTVPSYHEILSVLPPRDRCSRCSPTRRRC